MRSTYTSLFVFGGDVPAFALVTETSLQPLLYTKAVE